ncbi:probably inactive leucine-rich repeat receptor-like protein kinase At3g28040 [Setaria viridis]|uniref:probably inactive leucine-rich repeat receptor-like protein kinase At3g28040 n=1 Tax=Setaria viridis TaxID=4556 RepID=UPI001493AABF|nr:leucine-rich repeat receptor-like protein kinase PEPR1 [Setaria viridis]
MKLVFWNWFLLFFTLVLLSWGLTLDGLAHLALSKNLMLPSNISSSWNASNATPCRWNSVTCNRRGNVISLHLTSLGISGSLGPEIGYLKYLQVLSLSSNISGSIPPELGNCSMLEKLGLSQNFISSNIPSSIKNLKRLSLLSLYINSLNGTIPEELFKN